MFCLDKKKTCLQLKFLSKFHINFFQIFLKTTTTMYGIVQRIESHAMYILFVNEDVKIDKRLHAKPLLILFDGHKLVWASGTDTQKLMTA